MLLPKLTKKDIERFLHSIDQKSNPYGCWMWTKFKDKDGYGRFKINGKNFPAHRFAFILAGGLITKNKPWVLHKCDNPTCCNPLHLFSGTPKDNATDRDTKGRNGDLHGMVKSKKLTNKDVTIIRIVQNIISTRQLAKRFNLQKMEIHRIQKGTRWEHLPMPYIIPKPKIKQKRTHTRLTKKQVVEIRSSFDSKYMTITQLAEKYDKDYSTISLIVRRITWKNL